MKKSDKSTSADFDDFLKEEGILKEVRASALKKVASYRKAAKRRAPIYLNDEAQAFVEEIAQKRATNISAVVNEFILHDKQLIESAR